jgi:hypothetical protein
MADRNTAIFSRLGCEYGALDLEGYRQGLLNEALSVASVMKRGA